MLFVPHSYIFRIFYQVHMVLLLATTKEMHNKTWHL